MRVRGVPALLRQPRALGVLAAALAVCVLFVALGRWQWDRHEAKVAIRDLVHANYDAPPSPLEALLPSPARTLPPAQEWRPVTVSGTYDPARTVLARDRVRDGDNGYEVLVPLRTRTGVLVVDRGWIPAGRTARAPGAVPTPPTGTVTVTVRLRPWQPPSSRVTPAGQTGRISRESLSAATGADADRLFGAYGVLAAESVSAPVPITLLERPDTDLGPHLAYAIQWWGFALVLIGLLVQGARGQARRRDTESAPPTPNETDDGSGPPELTPTTASRRLVTGRWARLTASGGTVDEDAEEAEIAQSRPAGADASHAGGNGIT